MDSDNRKSEIPMHRMLDGNPPQNVAASSLRDQDGSYTNPFGDHLEDKPAVPERSREPFASNSSYTVSSANAGGPGSRCSCWYERSVMEKCLAVLFVLALLLAVIFLATLSTGKNKARKVEYVRTIPVNSSLCSSPECVRAAGELMQNLDASTSPCDNFYKFACGGWHKENPIPQTRDHWDTFSEAFEEVNFQIKGALEAPPANKESRAVRNLRKGYDACVNQSAWDEAGVAPLLDILKDFGGLPMITPEWEHHHFDLFKTIAKVRRVYDEQYLVGVYVIPDMKNSSRYALYLDEAFLPGDRELMAVDDSEERSKHIHRMSTIATMLYEGSVKAQNNPAAFPNHHFHEAQTRPNARDDPKSMYATNIADFLSKTLNNSKTHKNVTTNLANFAKPKTSARHPTPPIMTTPPPEDTTPPPKNTTSVPKGTTTPPKDTTPIQNGTTPAPTQPSSRKRSVLARTSALHEYVSRQSKLTASPSEFNGQAEMEQIKQEVVIRNDAWELWYFYVKLAQLMDQTPDVRDDEDTYNPMKVSDLDQFNHRIHIDWLAFLKDIFSKTNIVIDRNTEVVVAQPKYFHKLSQFLLATHPRVLANALLYQLTLNLGTEVTAPPRYTTDAEKVAGFIGRYESRTWFDCAQKMNNLMGLAMGRLFVNGREKDMKSKAKVINEMIGSLKHTLSSSLEQQKWLDAATKKEATKKAHLIHPVIGLPDQYMHDNKLDKIYEGLHDLSATDHFGNIKKLLWFTSTESLKKFQTVPSKDKVLSSPIAVNSYYSSQRNTLQFPMGMMTSPFFRQNTTLALQYGATGTIVAHELFHGFDVRGRKWDSRGNLRLWWTNKSLAEYLRRAYCYREQYGLLPVTQLVKDRSGHILKVNSRKTMAENIADAQGLMLAWDTFKAQKKPDQRLIGLEGFTPDQLFYISYGQIWCSNYSPEGLSKSLRFDNHSPNPFRVNGAVRNHPQFANAFQCPTKSNMVADKVCKIW